MQIPLLSIQTKLSQKVLKTDKKTILLIYSYDSTSVLPNLINHTFLQTLLVQDFESQWVAVATSRFSFQQDCS